MAAHNLELHHTVPRCLLRLHDEANGSLREAGMPLWVEFETECRRWGVEVEISREDLSALIARSTEVLDKERHRLIHSTDWQRWGRRGGLATLRLYGSQWFSLLALKRWGRISAEELDRARVLR